MTLATLGGDISSEKVDGLSSLDDGDEFLTLKEACSLPECDLKPVSLRTFISRGILPGKKYGNTWVIKRSDLFLYLDNRKVGRPRKNPI